jgi:hypothetical protein
VASRVSTERSTELSYNGVAASSGLEPEMSGFKVRRATDYPTRHRFWSCVRAEGFEPPVPEGIYFTGRRD